MNKALPKNLIMVLLLSITAFSVYKYAGTVKQNFNLTSALDSAKQQVGALEKEKQNLLQDKEKAKLEHAKLVQEKTLLQDNLSALKHKLIVLMVAYKKNRAVLYETNSKFSLLKSENTALTEKSTSLTEESRRLLEENASFKQRLNSLLELKKAIRELKIQMRSAARQKTAPAAVAAAEIKAEAGEIREGNHGFLVKDGKILSPSKVTIEVIPIPE